MYYKVVACCGNKLTSCCQNPLFPDEYRVEYKINEFVVPRIEGTKLFVFNDLQCAIDFAFELFGLGCYGEIWSCEITNPGPISNLSRFDLNLFRRYWAGTLSNVDMISTPEGTIGVDSVKLVERMLEI
jgi:hypothetical protein